MSGRERRASGRDRKAAQLGSVQPTQGALCANGFRLRKSGRHLDAAKRCEQALSIDPNHADALHLMGLLSSDKGHYDLAVGGLPARSGKIQRQSTCGTSALRYST